MPDPVATFMGQIQNIEKKLLNDLKQIAKGLDQLTDTELVAIAKELDFFQELLDRMQTDVVNSLFHVTTTNPAAPAGRRRADSAPQQTPMTQFRGSQNVGSTGNKIGRNAPCPCGSGKKYKRCCG